MKALLVAGMAFGTILLIGGVEQRPRERRIPTATVQVIAYEATTGRYIGAPDIQLFVDRDDQQDLAVAFHDGVATGIPYGTYHVEAKKPYYYSDETSVAVFQPSVTIVLGLRFAEELPDVPPVLTGHITGYQGPTDRVFAKLVGIYGHASAESSIDGKGQFTLGGLPDGVFLLMIVSDHGVLATRTLRIPYTGPPLQIDASTTE